jgi:LacI family transcriptional regulator
MNTFKEIDYSSLCGAVIIATELPEELYPVLRDIPVPFVVVDNMMPGTNYSCVGIDNFENIYTMLRFCKAMGYRTIGCLTSSFNVQNLQSREEAFMKYTNLLGLSPDKNWILSLPPETISVVKALAHILKNKKDCKLPQCFLAVNDMIALGAIRALEECGYRVPEDIGVMGFDDILYASLSAPPLTTIHVQREAIGRQAIRQLLHLIKDPASTAAKTAYVGELVVRNSMMDLTEKK